MGFSAAYCHTKCPKMYPFTWVFSIFPFGSQKWTQLVLFMLLHYFNFFFPSFSGLQVHPEAMTLIIASWDGCMDHRQFGGLASGYEVRIACSFCIFRCINTCWLLLFSLTWWACDILGEITVNPSWQERIMCQCCVLFGFFHLKQARAWGCSYVNRKSYLYLI